MGIIWYELGFMWLIFRRLMTNLENTKLSLQRTRSMTARFQVSVVFSLYLHIKMISCNEFVAFTPTYKSFCNHVVAT